MERRLAAIVATDAVGYSGLMHQNEEGTFNAYLASRKVIEPLVADYSGRIVKLTGDGALIEFSSIVDAVNFSVKAQQDLSNRNTSVASDLQLSFRMGVNLGDVIIQPEDIYGDGVNVAARLQQLAEPGAICVSQTVYEHVHRKVPFRFDYLGAKKVKNITDPIPVYMVRYDGAQISSPALPRPLSGRLLGFARSWKGLAMTIVIGAGLAAIVLLAFNQFESPKGGNPIPKNLSIAVLPFENMTPDIPFVDGITEDITTDLSRLAELLVISTNSTIKYKNQQVDPEKVSRELGVHYIVNGSIRSEDGSVRINAKLIDGSNGAQIWAERYDAKLTQIFDVQDQMTDRIVEALAIRLSADDRANMGQATADNIKAYEAFHTGWQNFRHNTPQHLNLALQQFKKAVEYDPNYSRAFAAIGYTYLKSWIWGWETNVGATWTTALDLARQYLEKARARPTPIVHQLASQLATYDRSHELAIAEARKAVELDPNEPNGLIVLAEALIFGGEPEKAKPYVEKALQVDPLNQAYSQHLKGMIYFCSKDYENAAIYFQKSLEANPEDFGPAAPLAASYALLNRDSEMKSAIAIYLNGWSDASIEMFRVYWPFKDEEVEKRLLGGLKKAGMRD